MIDRLYENMLNVDRKLFSKRLGKKSLDRSIFESLVDFGQPGLDPDVWTKDGDQYVLAEGVEAKILEFIKVIPARIFWLKRIICI